MAKAIFGDYRVEVEETDADSVYLLKLYFKDSLMYVVDEFNQEDLLDIVSILMSRKANDITHGFLPLLATHSALSENIYTKFKKMTIDTEKSIWSMGIVDYASTIIGALEANTSLKHSNVYIALPQKHIPLEVIENIQNACGEVMEALGYELEIAEEPVLGSFYQKIKFILSSPRTKQEVEEGFKKAKTALEVKYLSLPSAEATEKLSIAASHLITSLNGVEEGVLRVGGILIVKIKIEGITRVFAETLSPEVSLLLDKNPQIMSEPNTVYNLLQSMMNKNHFEGDETINVKQIGG